MALLKHSQLFGNTGRLYSRGLIYEIARDWETAVFTTKKEDWKGLYSLPSLYAEYGRLDPTEYLIAIEVFDSWESWDRFVSSPEVRPYIDIYRKENMMYHKAEALKEIINESKGGKNKFQASKFLWSEGFLEEEPKHKPKTKEEKGQVLSYMEDAERLGLKVVK